MKPVFHGLLFLLVVDGLASTQILKSKWGFFLENPSERPADQRAFIWVGGAWQMIIHHTSQYNDSGDIVSESSSFQDDSGVMIFSRSAYTYKEQHVLSGIRFQNKSDSGWRDRVFSRGLRQQYANADGSVSTITNNLNAQGIIETYQDWKSAPSNGKFSREERRAFIQGAWITQSRLETETNEKGLIVRETRHDFVTGALQEKTTTYHDSAGLTLSMVTEGYWREQWVYDTERHLIRYEKDLWQANAWSPWEIINNRYQGGKKRESELCQRIHESIEDMAKFKYQYFGGLTMQAETTLVSKWTEDGNWQLQAMDIVEKEEPSQTKKETHHEFVEGKLELISAYNEKYDSQNRVVEYSREDWNSLGHFVTTGGSSYDSSGQVTISWSKKHSPDGQIEGHRTVVSYWKGPSISPAQQAIPESKMRPSLALRHNQIWRGGLYLESPRFGRNRLDLQGKRISE